MSNLARLFALTKSEQRVVILIVFLLVAFAFMKRHAAHRDSISAPSNPAQTPEIVRPEEPRPADDD